MKKLIHLITALPAICTPLIGITSCNEPKSSNFSTDSWKTVCSYVSQGGINKLCEVYDCEPNDFVGKTRIVKLNGFEHKVMVVGINQDYTEYNSETGKFSKPVTLTFQFTNMISQQETEEGNYLGSYWSHDHVHPFEDPTICNSYYWGGNLCGFMNNDVYQMIKTGGNDNLYENIKNVYRGVNVASQQGSDWALGVQQTKLFPLNLANIFSKMGIEKTNKEVIPTNKIALYEAEGKQYLYYKDVNKIGDSCIVDDNWNWGFFECLKFEDCHGNGNFGENPIDIWLASPYILDINNVWRISMDGRASQNGSNERHAILPCFCL